MSISKKKRLASRAARDVDQADGGNEGTCMWLVECPQCERPKAPRGCVPVNDTEVEDYCTRTCPGYDQWPYPSAAPSSVSKDAS